MAWLGTLPNPSLGTESTGTTWLRVGTRRNVARSGRWGTDRVRDWGWFRGRCCRTRRSSAFGYVGSVEPCLFVASGGFVPICPARTIHRDGGVNRRRCLCDFQGIETTRRGRRRNWPRQSPRCRQRPHQPDQGSTPRVARPNTKRSAGFVWRRVAFSIKDWEKGGCEFVFGSALVSMRAKYWRLKGCPIMVICAREARAWGEQ